MQALPNTIIYKGRNKIYFIAFWLIWSVIHVWVLQEWKYTAEEAWIDSCVSNALLAAISLVIIISMHYYLPRKEQLTYFSLMCLGAAGIWITLTRFILSYIVPDGTLNAFTQSIPVRIAIAILILGCIILINVLLYAQEEQKEQERRKNESDSIARDAELYKLRQQLQPHFLFNSLNSISALVVTRPAEARKMIQQLSDYLRSTLKKEEYKWVSLEEELEYLRLYLDIEKVRFGHRLSTVLRQDEKALPLKLPALLLQPIVENAIKFGLYDTTENITISVVSEIENNMLVIRVQNPFDPDVSKPVKGTGFGLNSVQKRLFLLFARNDLLTTDIRENIFITQVKIPQ